MILRKIIPMILLLFSCILSIGNAQSDDRKATVILKNGTVLQGTVAEWSAGSKLKLLLDGNSSVVVDIEFSEIQSMDFGLEALPAKKVQPPTVVKPKLEPKDPRGMYYTAAVGVLLGEHETNFTIGAESGFRFNDHIAVGLGANYDIYDIVSVLPVWANTRFYLNNNLTAPYLFVGGGYGFARFNDGLDEWRFANEHIEGGLYGQTGIGFLVTGKNLSWALTMGGKFQRSVLNYEYNFQPWSSTRAAFSEVEEKRTFRRIFLNFSILF
jgi:hypothetical protein